MKRNLLAVLLLCASFLLSACGATSLDSANKAAPRASGTEEPILEASAPQETDWQASVTEETDWETFATEETEPEASVTGETALEASVTGETAPEASVTEKTESEASAPNETALEEASAPDETSGEASAPDAIAPDTDALEASDALQPSFPLPGAWHSDDGAGILTIYENGGFELTDADSYHEGYLLYTDEDGGPWESGPRYEMYLENNERLPNASLTWDEGHPGKLVYILGGGAELFSRGDCAYDADGIAVRVRWADENALSAFPAYDEYAAYSGEYEADILFVTERTLRNFKILSISLEDVSEDGTAVFAVTELFEENPLTTERPLMVRTSFPGDMPTNGISYTDGSGETRYFSVSESGFDGSLILSEIQRSDAP